MKLSSFWHNCCCFTCFCGEIFIGLKIFLAFSWSWLITVGLLSIILLPIAFKTNSYTCSDACMSTSCFSIITANKKFYEILIARIQLKLLKCLSNYFWFIIITNLHQIIQIAKCTKCKSRMKTFSTFKNSNLNWAKTTLIIFNISCLANILEYLDFMVSYFVNFHMKWNSFRSYYRWHIYKYIFA